MIKITRKEKFVLDGEVLNRKDYVEKTKTDFTNYGKVIVTLSDGIERDYFFHKHSDEYISLIDFINKDISEEKLLNIL